ncbi:MAG: hypothetical protein Q8S32_14570 [Burkholderiaceae bacterium]|nr:hypothetical protein [Burkholderiaceae bacterium]
MYHPPAGDFGLAADPVPLRLLGTKFGEGASPFAACNDPASPPAPAPALQIVDTNLDTASVVNKAVNTEAADWADLDRAYQAHHWTCPTCISAGKGYGLRCGTGAALWTAYDAEDMPVPKRAASATPALRRPATEIHPSLLTPASQTEIDLMGKRLALFDARGVDVDDAERLVDKLLVRDRELDRRGSCAECRHLVGSGPGRWRCNDRSDTSLNDLAGAHLGAGFVHQHLHHCPSLKGAA